MNVTIDVTPPELELIGVGEDMKAKGPVTISGKQKEDTLQIIKDGEYYTTFSDVLTKSGRYTVTVTDQADNSAVYQFTIMLYLDSNAVILIILTLLIVVFVAVYIYYERTHLRTR